MNKKPMTKEKTPKGKEVSIRCAVINKVLTGDKSAKQAAKELGKSERHVRRLAIKMQDKGKEGLLLKWPGPKEYSYNAYEHDYFLRDVLPHIKLNPEELHRLDTFARLMLRRVADLEKKSILIRMAMESLKLKKRAVYKIQRKAFMEGFWRILSHRRQKYILSAFPKIADSCTPKEWCVHGYDPTRSESENKLRSFEYERRGDKKTLLRTGKRTNYYPVLTNKTIHPPGPKNNISFVQDKTYVGSAKNHNSRQDRTLYKDSKYKDSKYNDPELNNSEGSSFYSFSEGEGKLKDFTSCTEKAKAAILNQEQKGQEQEQEQSDEFNRDEMMRISKAYILGIGPHKVSKEEFTAYLQRAKEVLSDRIHKAEQLELEATKCEAKTNNEHPNIPDGIYASESVPTLSHGIFEGIIQEQYDGQLWNRLTDDTFLDVLLLRRDLGESAPAIDIDPRTEVNCSACGTRRSFYTMSLHKYVANIILCSNCNVLLRGCQYATLREITKKLIDSVASSSKRRWSGWDSRIRSYLEFLNTPTTLFTLKRWDKSFDFNNYYNPFMADIMAEGKLLKANNDIVERDRQRLETIENHKKSELAEKEKQEHYRIYKQRVAEGRLPNEISFEVYMQMLPEIEREDSARERRRMKAELEAERIKNDPVYASEKLAKEKALIAESNAMMREIYEREKEDREL